MATDKERAMKYFENCSLNEIDMDVNEMQNLDCYFESLTDEERIKWTCENPLKILDLLYFYRGKVFG